MNKGARPENKISTVNIVRNKLVSRAFTVVHPGTPYLNMDKHAS
ncbi:hypothetical protein [Flagellimonas sp.]